MTITQLTNELKRRCFARSLVFFATVPCLYCLPGHAQSTEKANDLVSFLAGDWDDVSFEVSDGKPIKKESYAETMVIKNKDTLTITAHAFRDGKDLTKDMTLRVRGHHALVQQGGFATPGRREGNLYCLKGKAEGKEYRLRLYTMGDKYVFIREIWNRSNKVEQVDMSYLTRKP